MSLSRQLLSILFVFLLLLSGAAHAAPETPKKSDPNPGTNPVLASIISMGAKLYYIGSYAGLDGWFIVKDGQVQIAYALKDGKSIVVGALFGENGDNMTSKQVQELLDKNPELSATLNKSMAEKSAIGPAMSTLVPNGVNVAAASTMSPGEKLLQDLEKSYGVNLGTNTAAPQIQMIMDPNCPHCQATWRRLRDLVKANKLQIRLVPIGAENSDNERAAGQLLKSTDPLNAWDKYVGDKPGAGDKSQLAGTAPDEQVAWVRANFALVAMWKIQITPYLVYRDKDGKVKIIQGEVENTAALLSDLGL
jgi:thiol:disulfide interchange protein DsbG